MVKTRPRVGLSKRGDLLVGHPLASLNMGIAMLECQQYLRKALVLSMSKGTRITFKLDTDTEVVKCLSALPAGAAGMPGPSVKGDKLHTASIATNQQMRRHTKPSNRLKKGVSIPIQLIGKKCLDVITAKRPRR